MLLTSGGIHPNPSGDPQFVSDVEDLFAEHIGDAWLGRYAAAFVDASSSVTKLAAFNGTTDARFQIASCSKPFIGHLMADAITRSDIPGSSTAVGQVVEELTGGVVNATFAQLATHTSGIKNGAPTHNPDGTVDQLYASVSEDWDEEWVGEYRYSNMGASLCAWALARAAGFDEAYPTMIGQRIFTPLGMSHAYMPMLIGNVLPEDDPCGHEWDGTVPDPMPGGSGAPAGGIFCSITDLSKWLMAVAKGTAIGMDATNLHWSGTGIYMGWFWGYNQRPDLSIRLTHTGLTWGYSSATFIDKTHGKGVGVLADSAITDEVTAVASDLLVAYGGSP